MPRKALVILLLIDTVMIEDFRLFSVDHLQIMRALGKSSTFDSVCKGSTNGNQRKGKWFTKLYVHAYVPTIPLYP